ncbi:MAG: heme utilization protein, partial [Ignavibacteria bacterium]
GALTSGQIAALSSDQMASMIPSMSTAQIAALTTDQVVALTTGQIVALTTAQVKAIATAGVAALTTDQIQAIETQDLSKMTTAQVKAFSTMDIAALQTDQVQALTSAQVTALTTSQAQALRTDEIAALTTGQIGSLTTAAVAALTTDQVQAFETTDFAKLTTAQIRVLGTDDVVAIGTDHIAAMVTAQVAAMTSAQAQALTTDEIVALSTLQIKVLTTAAVAALTTDQVMAIETTDLVKMTTAQIAAISSSDIQALTTDQVIALTTAQVHALTTSELQALTTEQLNALPALQKHVFLNSVNAANIGALATDAINLLLASPLVLDLNDDGVKTTGLGAGVHFDLRADGHATNVGWVSPHDGFLALDRNNDGLINDGSELFGTATRLATGKTAANGFEALRELDTNHDGVIDARDAHFKDLRVWTDTNQDGVSQPGELHRLADLGIARLDLHEKQTSALDNGNWIGLESTFTTEDGKAHALADVWMQIHADQNQTIDLTQLNPAAFAPGAMARIDVAGNGGQGDTVILNAHNVEALGRKDLVVNDQTGSGHVQMIIHGDANDVVKLADGAGQWKDGGMTVVDGEAYHILNHDNLQLLVGVKIHEVSS